MENTLPSIIFTCVVESERLKAVKILKALETVKNLKRMGFRVGYSELPLETEEGNLIFFADIESPTDSSFLPVPYTLMSTTNTCGP